MKSSLFIIYSFFSGLSVKLMCHTKHERYDRWVLCNEKGEIPDTDMKGLKVITDNAFMVIHVFDTEKSFRGIYRGIYKYSEKEYI